MVNDEQPKILVFCTVGTGLDAIAEVIRRGYSISGIVGLHPEKADPILISGYVDVADFSVKYGLPHYYVRSYNLKEEYDYACLTSLSFDIIWVNGWQRLLPEWLIEKSRLGVLGGHGSPDGIHGGRGRSPQNWALLLGCERFDLALFRITPGVDDGPVVAQRSFCFTGSDDIAVSYYRVSLAMADMICEVLQSPEKLEIGVPQPVEAYYYPQRKPEDGWVDWTLPKEWIARHCRALTTPYPGLKTSQKGVEIILWHCQPFDDVVNSQPGCISVCFGSGDFLVSCRDGRLLVRRWQCHLVEWHPKAGMEFDSIPFSKQLDVVIERHKNKTPQYPISPRILRWI